MKNPFLRVKLKSLAAEARIIRIEEVRAGKQYDLQGALRDHRIFTVRRAARETLLAYQYLRGIPYEVVEKPNSKAITLKPIVTMTNKYGQKRINENDLLAWMNKTAKIAAIS